MTNDNGKWLPQKPIKLSTDAQDSLADYSGIFVKFLFYFVRGQKEILSIFKNISMKKLYSHKLYAVPRITRGGDF